jgi:multidrug efflux pump
VVSLTLTPMMAARLLRHKPESEQGRMYRASENAFNAVINFYGRTLRWVLGHQPETLFIAVATLALTFYLAWIIPKGFFPVQDTGVILGISEAPQTVSFPAMAARQQELAKVILKDPAVESLSSFIGVDGINSTLNSGRIQINLKPQEVRKISSSDIIRRLQPQLDKVDGITLFMQAVQDLSVEDRVSRTQYQYSLEDPDPKELADWNDRFVAKLQTIPFLRDVASDQQNLGLQARLVIDRVTASRLGITPQMIDNTLYDAFGQRQISIMFTQLNQYRVVMEIKPDWQQRPSDLRNLYIRSSINNSGTAIASSTSAPSTGSAGTNPISAVSSTSSGSGSTASSGAPTTTTAAGQVPLDAIAHYETATTPLTVNHQGQFPSSTVSFNLAPTASLGEAVTAIDKVKAEMGMPASIQTSFQGTAAAFINSLSNEGLLLLAAVITVYIVLGVLYESYIHPVTILSTLPSAGVGALLALIICRNDFSVIALIGVILLIGIVKKNAIMMIDFALEAERKEKREPLDAIYQACLLRFRPIMMTTMAALLGGIPLALGTGTGSELRRPLGISIIGGLLLSQLLTLYTTPVIYLYFDRLARRFGKSAAGVEIGTEPEPEGA